MVICLMFCLIIVLQTDATSTVTVVSEGSVLRASHYLEWPRCACIHNDGARSEEGGSE